MNTPNIKFIFCATIALTMAVVLLVMPIPTRAAPTALTFTVNSPSDIPDANPGNGVCETAPGNGICTLRAAIQEANAHAGGDTIMLPAGTYLLTRVGVDDTALNGDLDITHGMSIVGAGANSTIIDGNGGVIGERVFQITGTVSISGVTIEHGHESNVGGGILNNGSLTLANSAIISNTASGINDWGGGIYNSGSLTLTNSTISGNTTGNHNAYGGGIFNQGPMTITNSTISGNTTFASTSPYSPGYGGGIYNGGYTATVKSSAISGNTAAYGGGIYKAGYPIIVINSTLSGNYSTVDGGGIYNGSGTTSLFNVTLTRNRSNSDDSGSGMGGGVANAAGSTFNFMNSIIALNENIVKTLPFPTLDDDDCSGTILSQGNNIMYLIDSSHCTVNGAVTIADPSLGPLQNNGGPTQTHALLTGSPAIDAGNPGGCTDNFGAILTTDQRGFPRPANGLCDVGAVERQLVLYLPLIER